MQRTRVALRVLEAFPLGDACETHVVRISCWRVPVGALHTQVPILKEQLLNLGYGRSDALGQLARVQEAADVERQQQCARCPHAAPAAHTPRPAAAPCHMPSRASAEWCGAEA